MKKRKENKNKINSTPSSTPVLGQPEDVFELINKYGTYEIQPTSDSDNTFPEIAQGLADNSKKSISKADLLKDMGKM